MRKTAFALCLALVLAALAAAQEMSPDAKKAMEAYEKAGAVTAQHQALKYFVGLWDVEATMWTAPGVPPSVSKNTNQAALILGGRYVKMDYRGRMMGQPFEGLQINGYDNITKVFTTLWIDNTSTSFYQLTGTYDEAGKTYTFKGNWADPITGTTPVRMVLKIVGPDEFVSETFSKMPDGKDFKMMSDRYIRRKRAGVSG